MQYGNCSLSHGALSGSAFETICFVYCDQTNIFHPSVHVRSLAAKLIGSRLYARTDKGIDPILFCWSFIAFVPDVCFFFHWVHEWGEPSVLRRKDTDKFNTLGIARAVFLFGEGILRLFWGASACQRFFSRAEAVAKWDEWRPLRGGELLFKCSIKSLFNILSVLSHFTSST